MALSDDLVISESLHEFFFKLFEINQPPQKRKKFANLINSYILPDLVAYCQTEQAGNPKINQVQPATIKNTAQAPEKNGSPQKTNLEQNEQKQKENHQNETLTHQPNQKPTNRANVIVIDSSQPEEAHSETSAQQHPQPKFRADLSYGLLIGILLIVFGNLNEDKNKVDGKEDKILQMMSTSSKIKNFSILELFAAYFDKFPRGSEFITGMVKLMKSVLESGDQELIAQLVDLKYFDYILNLLLKYKRRKNLLYSAALSVINLVVKLKLTDVVAYIGANHEALIVSNQLNWEKDFRNLMSLYRMSKDNDNVSDAVEGNFASAASSTIGKSSFDESMMLEGVQKPPIIKKGRIGAFKIIDDELELLKMKKRLIQKTRNKAVSEAGSVSREGRLSPRKKLKVSETRGGVPVDVSKMTGKPSPAKARRRSQDLQSQSLPNGQNPNKRGNAEKKDNGSSASLLTKRDFPKT